jgi:hypothetical protein
LQAATPMPAPMQATYGPTRVRRAFLLIEETAGPHVEGPLVPSARRRRRPRCPRRALQRPGFLEPSVARRRAGRASVLADANFYLFEGLGANSHVTPRAPSLREPTARPPPQQNPRSATVTVRGHCASSVPATSTCACFQVGCVNRQAKGCRTDTIATGKGLIGGDCLWRFGRPQTTPPPFAARSRWSVTASWAPATPPIPQNGQSRESINEKGCPPECCNYYRLMSSVY